MRQVTQVDKREGKWVTNTVHMEGSATLGLPEGDRLETLGVRGWDGAFCVQRRYQILIHKLIKALNVFEISDISY